MNYFLAKTEPSTYSIDDLERDRHTAWDGVTNPQAVRAIREMKPGDIVFIYHSGGVSSVVGMAAVKSPPRDDPKNPKSAVVDLEFAGRRRAAGDVGGDQAVGQVRRLGAGAARPALDDGGAGKVRRVDARAKSEGEDLGDRFLRGCGGRQSERLGHLCGEPIRFDWIFDSIAEIEFLPASVTDLDSSIYRCALRSCPRSSEHRAPRRQELDASILVCREGAASPATGRRR